MQGGETTDANALAGPRSIGFTPSTMTMTVGGPGRPISVPEFLMSLAVLGQRPGGERNVKAVIANASASASASDPIPRPPGSPADMISRRNALSPYTAAEVLEPMISLRALDVSLHHLPEGFFAALPRSLETLTVRLPALLPAVAELAEAAASSSGLPPRLASVHLELATTQFP